MPVQQSPGWETVVLEDATLIRRLEELEEQSAGECAKPYSSSRRPASSTKRDDACHRTFPQI
jgi:hypothetical protein